MSVNSHIEEIDHGWDRIQNDLRLLDNSYTKVGLPEESQPASVEDGITEMSDLVLVYAANEFGTKRIPERSTLRAALDENLQQVNRLTFRLYDKVITNTISVRNALSIIGEFMTNKVKKKIVNLKTPPNAPSTLRAKYPKTNPLINKGQLVQSITHVEVLE
jgi:hypothetical protein